MFIRRPVVVVLFLVLSACGGGGSGSTNDGATNQEDAVTNTDVGNEQQEPETRPDSISSYIPIDSTRLIGFDTFNDDRIFRSLTEDGLIATVYGTKSNDGDINDFTGLNIENNEGEYLELDIDSVLDVVVLRAQNATYKLFVNANGELIYRVEVEDQFIEYEIVSDAGTLEASYPETFQYKGKNHTSSFTERMNTVTIPSANIAIGGCPAEVQNISVRAYNGRGAFLNQFRTNKNGQDDEYEVLLPGLSEFDARVADFSGKFITFLDNYKLPSFIEKEAVNTLGDIGAGLVRRGISEQTNLIDDLLDNQSFFDRLGVTGGSISTVVPSLKRVALRGLSAIFKFADIPSLIDESIQLGESLASLIDLASSVQHDQVAFEVVVLTKSGETIRSIRSSLVSSAGPYPALSITVPCLDYRPQSLIGSDATLFSTYDYTLDNGQRIVGSCSVPGFVSFPDFKLKLDESSASIVSGFYRTYGPVEGCFGDYTDPNNSHNLTLDRVGNILVGSYGPAADRWTWNLFVSEDGKSIVGKAVNNFDGPNPVGGRNTGELTIDVSLSR